MILSQNKQYLNDQQLYDRKILRKIVLSQIKSHNYKNIVASLYIKTKMSRIIKQMVISYLITTIYFICSGQPGNIISPIMQLQKQIRK